jgi:DnaJ-class molecular chaperone
MTDEEWEAQNRYLSQNEALMLGLCWHCGGQGANWTAFGGVQRKVTCGLCLGNGKAH